MSDEVAIEYLVVGDNEQVLERTEIEHQLLEIATQGPPGPTIGNGPLDMHGNPVFNVQTVGFQGEYDNGDSGFFKTVMLVNSQKQRVRVTQSPALLEISGAGAPVGHYQLRIVQDATGGRAVSFQGLMPNRWLNSDVTPPLNTNPHGESILSVFWDGSQFTQALAKVGAL